MLVKKIKEIINTPQACREFFTKIFTIFTLSIPVYFIFSWINPHVDTRRSLDLPSFTINNIIVCLISLISATSAFYLYKYLSEFKNSIPSSFSIFKISFCTLIIITAVGSQIFIRAVWLAIDSPEAWGRSLTAIGAAFSSLIAVIGVITTVSINQSLENEKIRQSKEFDERKATREIISDLNDRYLSILQNRTSENSNLRSLSNFAFAGLYLDWEKLNDSLENKLEQKDHQQKFILKTIFSNLETTSNKNDDIKNIEAAGNLEKFQDFGTQQIIADLLVPPGKKIDELNLAHSKLIDLNLDRRNIEKLFFDSSEIDRLSLIENTSEFLSMNNSEVNEVHLTNNIDIKIDLSSTKISESSLDIKNNKLDISINDKTFLKGLEIHNAKINNVKIIQESNTWENENNQKLVFINCKFVGTVIKGCYKEIKFASCTFENSSLELTKDPITQLEPENTNNIPAFVEEPLDKYISSMLFINIEDSSKNELQLILPKTPQKTLKDYLESLDLSVKKAITEDSK